MNQQLETCHSPHLNELFMALCKAQVVMKPASFNKVNPHLKNRYADFTSCMDACRQPLALNGLAVLQFTETENGEIYLCTMLGHTSGQWIKSKFPLITAKKDSQGYGAAMTYAKRYTLSSMIGLVSDDDDDDGEMSVGRGNGTPNSHPKEKNNHVPPKKSEKIMEEQIHEIDAMLKKCRKDFIVKCDKHVITTYGSYQNMDQNGFNAILNRINEELHAIDKEKSHVGMKIKPLEVSNAA